MLIRNELELASLADHSSYVSHYRSVANTSSFMNLLIKLTLTLSIYVFSSYTEAKNAATEDPDNKQQTTNNKQYVSMQKIDLVLHSCLVAVVPKVALM